MYVLNPYVVTWIINGEYYFFLLLILGRCIIRKPANILSAVRCVLCPTNIDQYTNVSSGYHQVNCKGSMPCRSG